MRRITLDANVLAPGFTGRGSASARLIDLWQAGAFSLILYDHILAELSRTFTDQYFAARLTPEEAASIIALLSSSVVARIVAVHGIATHPEDDLVIASALSGKATMLCTRDKQLLRLRQYETLAILSPGELLALLDDEAGRYSGLRARPGLPRVWPRHAATT